MLKLAGGDDAARPGAALQEAVQAPAPEDVLRRTHLGIPAGVPELGCEPGGSPARRQSSPATSAPQRLLPLTLTALGVVYGDIGTSPLYALRQCFFGSHSVPPTHENVLGVLSLIIYALLLVISIKYVAIVMRADNQGEGGVLALTALIPSRSGVAGGPARLAVGRPVLIALGIFGTALLYGDGMITPAISVLGAVE